MKIIQTLIATWAVFAFAGCSTLPAKMSRLHEGMSKEQVVQLLGKPSAVGTGTHYASPNVTINDGFSEVFRYHRPAQDWIVVFFHDKLTEYGPFTSDLRMRYGGVFAAK